MRKGTDIDKKYESGRFSLIAALGRSRQLGKAGQLLWHLPDDMQRFKALTMGHPVIMGSRTWESLPERFRPLSGRTNIVVSDLPVFKAQGAIVVHSLEDARAAAARAEGADEIFAIGGGMLYASALPFAKRLYLTLVDDDAEGDVFFPPYENDFKIVSEEVGVGNPSHHFIILERK